MNSILVDISDYIRYKDVRKAIFQERLSFCWQGKRLRFFDHGHRQENQVLSSLLNCFYKQTRSSSLPPANHLGSSSPSMVCKLYWDGRRWHLRPLGKALWTHSPYVACLSTSAIEEDEDIDVLQSSQGKLRDLPAKCRTKKPARFIFKENKLTTPLDTRGELEILRDILLKTYSVVPQEHYEKICHFCKYDPCLSLPQDSGIPLAPNFEKVLMKNYEKIPLSYGNPDKILRCCLRISAET